jgi:hypothetical protein
MGAEHSNGAIGGSRGRSIDATKQENFCLSMLGRVDTCGL